MTFPRNAGQPFTAADDKEIRQMHTKRFTVAQIAARLERTEAGIKARLERLELVKSNVLDKQRALMAVL